MLTIAMRDVPVKIHLTRHFLITCALFVGLAPSLTAMQLAFDKGDRLLTKLFGASSGVLCIAATGSFWVQATRYVARRQLEKSRTGHRADSPRRVRDE